MSESIAEEARCRIVAQAADIGCLTTPLTARWTSAAEIVGRSCYHSNVTSQGLCFTKATKLTLSHEGEAGERGR